MRILLLLLITSTALRAFAEDPLVDTRLIEEQRRRNHAEAEAGIRNLNYYRMKIVAIDTQLKDLDGRARKVITDCGPGISDTQVESCTTDLGLMYEDARHMLNRLEVMSTSAAYVQLIRSPENQTIRLDDLVNASRQALAKYLRGTTKLQSKLGTRLAEIRYSREIQRIQDGQATARLKTQCALEPSRLIEKFMNARLSRRQATSDRDPYLIVRGDGLAKQARDAARALVDRCTERQKAVDLGVQIEAFLAQTPDAKTMDGLFRQACVKINVSAAADLRAACAREEFTPAIAFSLHQQLVSQARR